MIVVLIVVVMLMGLYLPKSITHAKETVYNCPIDTVYHTVINNHEWQYRKSLDELRILESHDGMEVWEEISNGYVVQFKTTIKKPLTFYSFAMDCTLFEGHWKGEFYSLENDKTRFVATEHLVYKNAIARIKGYLFLNIDKFMEVYQSELRAKVE